MEVGADFAADAGPEAEEGVVGRRRAVLVQAQDDPAEVGVVRRRTAELVVRHRRPGAGGRRSAGKVLQVAAASEVTDEDVELAVATERQHAAVVVAARGLAGVLLDGPDPDQRAVEGQRRSVPDEPVDPVAQQRRLAEHVGVRAGAALRPVEEDPRVPGEARMQRDAEQAAFGAEVDGQVEDRAVDGPGHDALDPAGGLLQDQHVAAADERQGGRRDQPRGGRPDGQLRVQHHRAFLRAGRRGHQHRGHGHDGQGDSRPSPRDRRNGLVPAQSWERP